MGNEGKNIKTDKKEDKAKQDKNISKENEKESNKRQENNSEVNEEQVENKADNEGAKHECKKNDDKKEEKSELDIQIEKTKEAEDKYIRLFAEFQNFRNRTEKEKLDMYDIGVSSALLKFLPVVDNIERALENIPEDLKTNPFVDGIDKVYKQVQKIFEELDVKPIEAKGKMFDANLHNAVMTDETSDAEVDTITEEMLKGYTYKDQVLRHSMVKVKK